MNNAETITKAISGSLNIIEQEREREIISRRFGLNGHKETLEQIGEMLSITRERVRQLEKAILIRLRIAAEEGRIADLAPAEKLIVRNLTEMGRAARASDLAKKILGREASAIEKANFGFLGEISPVLTIINENDKYYNTISIAEYGDEKAIRVKVDEIVSLVKANKKPISIEELDEKLNYEHPSHIEAIARLSKSIQRTFVTRFTSCSKKSMNQCISTISPRPSAPAISSAKMSQFKPSTTNSSRIHASSLSVVVSTHSTLGVIKRVPLATLSRKFLLMLATKVFPVKKSLSKCSKNAKLRKPPFYLTFKIKNSSPRLAKIATN